MPQRIFVWLLLCCFASSSTAYAEAETATLSVDLRLGSDQATSAVPIEGVLMARSKASHGAEMTQMIEVPGTAEFHLASPGRWELSVHAEGFWAESQTIAFDGAQSKRQIDVVLEQGGTVKGRIAVPPGKDMPKAMTLRHQGRHGADEDRVAIETCSIVENTKGAFTCPVPAGNLDLRLQAADFGAHYRWNVEVPWKSTTDLGTVRLKEGASVVGWVLLPDRDPDLVRGSVELIPLVGGLKGRNAAEQHQSAALNGPVNARGFFHISGAPAGSYLLRVTHPRFSAATVAPLLLRAAQETELEPIELVPPVSLRLEVEPKSDPFHKPWTYSLLEGSADPSAFDEIDGGPVPNDGIVQLDFLDRSLYQLLIEDSQSGLWHAESIDLSAGSEVVQVSIPLKRLEVVLTLDDEPVDEARVTFRALKPGLTFHRTSNDEGSAYFFLPHDKTWQVFVSHLESGIGAEFDDIEIPERRRGDRAPKLELEIPATRIEGRVVHPEGHPPSSAASILAASDLRAVQFETDLDGSFALRGLHPGRYRIQAEASERREEVLRSDIVVAEAREDLVTGPIELVLRQEILLSGLVVGSSGLGVPGSHVVATLEYRERANSSLTLRETYTNLDGVFELRVPSSGYAAQLAVFPPGYAATQQRVDLEMNETVVIPVNEDAGEVTILFGNPSEIFNDKGFYRNIRLIHDRLVVGVASTLRPWARLHQVSLQNDRIVLPMMAPGNYTVCFELPLPIWQSGNIPSHLSSVHCASGFLGSGGQLVLEIPETAYEAVDANK